jgi:hypothetical protein
MTGRMAAQRFGSDADAKLILQALSLNFWASSFSICEPTVRTCKCGQQILERTMQNDNHAAVHSHIEKEQCKALKNFLNFRKSSFLFYLHVLLTGKYLICRLCSLSSIVEAMFSKQTTAVQRLGPWRSGNSSSPLRTAIWRTQLC